MAVIDAEMEERRHAAFRRAHALVPGYRLEAVPDTDWRPVTGEKTCRRRLGKHDVCPSAAVAEFNRRTHGRDFPYPSRDSWWGYCPEHMYGRWIENGTVMHWVLGEEVP
jgi:hypothetical protein